MIFQLMILPKRKVIQLPRKLVSAIQTRLFIANELRDTDLVVEQVEFTDGSKPRILIRIKAVLRKARKNKGNLTLPEAADWKRE